MTDEQEVEVRYDTLGRRIHTSRRGPVAGEGRGGRRNEGMLQARVPLSLLEQVDEVAATRPRQGALPRRGRASVVVDALELYFQGDATRWQRKFLAERQLRIEAERRLARAREALG